ncbi:CCA tRNA nucleotidyltransferase [Clostridium rectalis]|uniref:CCA tRNA nucleotidyltransferase n=1 Tax=Clostridium rectalis TaxID=2040295 RepID=UPI000F63A1F1|nr:CCA tRNA nucleotidyltransferase [Clostridium rectalis]
MKDKNFKINIPKEVEFILNTLEKNTYEAYIVGGCVRDTLLNKKPKDWDITTSAKVEKVKAVFKQLGCKVIDTGIKHGTVTILINNTSYEVTTYRIDGKYSDGRHPDKVEFTGILREDLKRRDFTINAMAYNYKEGLIDYFSGINDLKNKTINCVGNPIKRFSEDALRMIRAVRFSAQLGFDIEGNTEKGIKCLNKNIKCVSIERIREEFNKILLSDNISRIHCLYDYGLIKYFLPEYVQAINNNYETSLKLKNYLINNVSCIPKSIHVRLAMILKYILKLKYINNKNIFYDYDQLAKESQEILKRIKYDKNTIYNVANIIKFYNFSIENNKSIRKLLSILGEELTLDLLKIKEHDILKNNNFNIKKHYKNCQNINLNLEKILKEHQCINIKDLSINGDDLIKLGFRQGKDIGKILKDVFIKVLDDPSLNQKDKLIDLVKKNTKFNKN